MLGTGRDGVGSLPEKLDGSDVDHVVLWSQSSGGFLDSLFGGGSKANDGRTRALSHAPVTYFRLLI